VPIVYIPCSNSNDRTAPVRSPCVSSSADERVQLTPRNLACTSSTQAPATTAHLRQRGLFDDLRHRQHTVGKPIVSRRNPPESRTPETDTPETNVLLCMKCTVTFNVAVLYTLLGRWGPHAVSYAWMTAVFAQVFTTGPKAVDRATLHASRSAHASRLPTPNSRGSTACVCYMPTFGSCRPQNYPSFVSFVRVVYVTNRERVRTFSLQGERDCKRQPPATLVTGDMQSSALHCARGRIVSDFGTGPVRARLQKALPSVYIGLRANEPVQAFGTWNRGGDQRSRGSLSAHSDGPWPNTHSD
jgi:hypothetical protein